MLHFRRSDRAAADELTVVLGPSLAAGPAHVVLDISERGMLVACDTPPPSRRFSFVLIGGGHYVGGQASLARTATDGIGINVLSWDDHGAAVRKLLSGGATVGEPYVSDWA
jgi:hypothetical protein